MLARIAYPYSFSTRPDKLRSIHRYSLPCTLRKLRVAYRTSRSYRCPTLRGDALVTASRNIRFIYVKKSYRILHLFVAYDIHRSLPPIVVQIRGQSRPSLPPRLAPLFACLIDAASSIRRPLAFILLPVNQLLRAQTALAFSFAHRYVESLLTLR